MLYQVSYAINEMNKKFTLSEQFENIIEKRRHELKIDTPNT